MKIKFLTTLLTALPLLTAGLYLIGLTYLEGYYEVYGVLTTLFPVAPDQALFNGFMQFTVLSFRPSSVLIIIFLMLFFMTLDLNNSWSLSFTKTNILLNEKLSKTQLLILKLAFFFICFTLFLYLAANIILSSYGTGKIYAKTEIANFEKNDITIANILYKHESAEIERIEKAMQIVCNSTFCAYWVGTETRILQLDRITKISISPKDYVAKSVKKILK